MAFALSEVRPRIQHIINIPEQIEPELPEECCIYKVSVHLHKLNVEAYTPLFISIGPFHNNNSELKQEKLKQRYFHAFWNRLNISQALALEEYKTFLKENREKIGECYSKPELCQEDQFVDMILLDSVFIMELFLRKSDPDEQKSDHMFTTSWIRKTAQRDLLLLENQLPMFVLEELIHKVWLHGDNATEENHRIKFLELAFKYFEDYYPHKSDEKRMTMIKKYKSCKHFTDLIRYTYLPEKVQDKGVNPSQQFPTCRGDSVLKTATKLHEAGVSFEIVKCRSYLDIRFKTIPILSWFLCFGWNLIALEQCHYSDQPFICKYVSMIDSLIHTQEDVELLVDKEAIVHQLGSHTELATMINGLCKHVVVIDALYGDVKISVFS